MWLYIAVIPIVISVLIGGPLLFKSGKVSKVFLWEYLALVCPILIWDLMTLKSIGSQSLSNIVEVYFVAVAAIAYSVVRLKRPSMRMNQKVIGVLLLMVLPIILRLFFPSLPE